MNTKKGAGALTMQKSQIQNMISLKGINNKEMSLLMQIKYFCLLF